MGNHRADRRAPRRASSTTPEVSPSVSLATGAGRRRAAPPARAPFTAKLPSSPILMGITALAISAGGALTAGQGVVLDAAGEFTYSSQVSALGGTSSVATVTSGSRPAEVSRSASRDSGADDQLKAAVEQQAAARNQALSDLAKKAEQQSAKIKENAWVLPTSGYRLTATYGEYGLWSSYHTGLDFAGAYGTPLYAVANGVITSTGSDGAYGYKTVLTLEDGTEIWYCHQSSFAVSVGEEVYSGDTIGYMGATGHVTGTHLHLEVRPGGGDPVDPYSALLVHGVQP